MQHTKNLRLMGMLALAVALAIATGPQAQQTAVVDETLGRPAPVGGPAAGGGPVPAGGTEAILDDFNRADGPIGAAWTVHDGYCNVVSNAAVCGSSGRATFIGAPGAGDEAAVDIAANGTELQYAGLLLNYGAGATNLFLKVQEQSPYAGQFTNAACYTGNNTGSFGLGFFSLTSPFTTAHMEATRVNDDVTIVFSNIDGGAQPDQTYVCTGAPAREGTGIGIIGYAGIARMDNFGTPGGGQGEPLTCNGPTVTFEAGPPVDWTVVDNAGNGVVWTTIVGSGETGNWTNGSGEAASVSSDAFGSADYDTELRTPPFSTVGQLFVELSFTANYQNFAAYDFLDVDVSTDGGTNWTNVLRWNEDHGAFRATPGEDVVLDISSVAGNQPSVIVRWRYYDPTTTPDYDWYAQIDNASLACDIPVELMGLSVE